MNPTLEQVWVKVQELYSASTPHDQRAVADTWLKSYQQSAAAWQTLPALLQASPEGVTAMQLEQVQFFASNSLRSKIKHGELSQLEPENRPALRNILIEQLVKFRNGPPAVRKQLSLAFSAYAGNFERGKTDVVQEVCTLLGGNPETIPVLLELLQLLGEEADHVMEEYAETAPEDVHPLVISARTAAMPVLNFLHQCFAMTAQEPDERKRAVHQSSIISCFGRWLRFDAVPMDQLAASPIVQAALSSLDHPEICDSSSDLLCELAYISQDVNKGLPLYQLLSSRLQTFYQVFQKALKEEDEVLARAVTRVVAEMGESYCPLIAQASPDAVAMVNFLVELTAFPERRVGILTYNFWWRLCANLRQPELLAQREERLAALRPSLSRLLQVLAKAASVSDDDDELQDTYQEEEFESFRLENLRDCVLDVSEMLSPSVAIQVLDQRVRQELEAIQTQSAPGRWRQVEGALFVAAVVARGVPSDSPDPAPAHLLELALSPALPTEPRVHCQMMGVVGRFGPWLAKHVALLGPLLDYVVQGLGRPAGVGSAAAQALQLICDDCAEHMASPAPLQGLLSLYASMGSLSAEQQERIVGGLGTVLSRVALDQVQPMILAVSQPPLHQAGLALQANKKGELIVELKKLRMLMKSGVNALERMEDAGGEAAAAAVASRRDALAGAWASAMTSLWPVLEAAMGRYGGEEDLMEDLCLVVRSGIKATGRHFGAYLGPFATAAVNCFLTRPLSCLLYVVTTIISAFGREPALVPALSDMLAAMASKSFEVMSQPGAMVERPDVVNEFFELLGRAVRRFPERLLPPAPGAAPAGGAGDAGGSRGLGAAAFDLAEAALTGELCHREALQAMLGYLENLALADANDRDPARHQVDRAAARAFFVWVPAGSAPRGLRAARAVLLAVATKPSAVVEPAAAALLALGQLCPDEVGGWVAGGLEATAPFVREEFRRRFLEDMGRARDARGAKDAVRALFRASKPP